MAQEGEADAGSALSRVLTGGAHQGRPSARGGRAVMFVDGVSSEKRVRCSLACSVSSTWALFYSA
jgi:hypothetical protein